MCAIAKRAHCMQRLLRSIFTLLIACYKYGISPCLPVSCRFYPTCSAYALSAVTHYGLMRGLSKTVGRLLRCHPWSAGGYDPVLPTEREK